MMHRKVQLSTVLVLLGIIISIPVESQVVRDPVGQSAQQYAMGEGYYRGRYEPMAYQLPYEDIEGSPYMIDDLLLGKVYFRAGDTSSTYMRYNIYEDAIEYLKEEQLYAITNPHNIDSVVIGSDRFVYRSYLIEGKLEKGYLIDTSEGRIHVYRKPVVSYIEPEDPLTGYHQARPAKFHREHSLWFVRYGNQYAEFELGKSQLQSLLGKDFSEVENFRKKQKLKLKRDLDAKKYFEFYNSLPVN